MVSKNNFLLFILFFLTFLGFYACILLLFQFGVTENTQKYTIPIRAFIGISYLYTFIKNYRYIIASSQLKLFLIFSFLYLLRVIVDLLNFEFYYLSTQDIIFYYLSFAFIPFIAIVSLKITSENLSKIVNALIYSGLLFSTLAFLLYSKFIGQVTRLSTNTASEEVISPLILSYCSALVIGVNISYFLFNKHSFLKRIIIIASTLMAIVPFFLGASRGALVGLVFPFFILMLFGKSIRYYIITIFLMIVLIIGLISLDEYLGSGLLERLFNTSQAIEQNDSSAIRVVIWESSFKQFINNPIFGDKLRVDNWENYPHNIFLEVLQTTGFLGFVPFVILIFQAFKICFKIFGNYRQYSWLAIVFVQSFAQNMFSGSLYIAAWFWTSMAILFAFNNYLKLNQNDI